MAGLSIGFIGSVILNFLIFLLLIAAYTYIVKLEQTGCKCAEHGNQKFIKNFSLFAIGFLFIITFIPIDAIINSLGPIVAGLFALITFIFYIMCVVYFFMVLNYTRYLVNEKCKCSEDIRRDIIMIGSVIEIVLIMLILLTALILPILLASVSVIVNNMDTVQRDLSEGIRHPVESLRKIPSKLQTTSKSLANIVRETSKGLKKVVTKKKTLK